MTLVEVVGGLGLLATLLVALLMAKARFTRQAAAADRRLQAVAAADALLSGWHQNPRMLPRSGGGVVSGDAQFSWRTQRVANAPVNDMGAAVVRLEILDDRSEAAANPVVTSVEFVVEPEPVGTAGAAKEGAGSPKPATPGKRTKAAKDRTLKKK
jgi:hypothetical protein